MADRWIIITGWDKFQHPDVGRSNRHPIWVKNYVALLHKDEYLELTGPQRALLHGLWMMYAKSARKVPENTAKLSRKLNLRVTKRTLEALSNAGFIEFLQADCKQSMSLEVEVEVERLAFTSTEDHGKSKGKPDYEFPININDILEDV